MITWDNYEEYMMMHADGELTRDEELALQAFVIEHPELKKEMAAYGLTQLKPDTTQVFTNKESLLKPLPVTRTIAFPRWRKYSIAAAVVLLVGSVLLRYTKPQTPKGASPQVVRNESIKREIPTIVKEGDSSGTSSQAVAKNTIEEKQEQSLREPKREVIKTVVAKAEKVAVADNRSRPEKQQSKVVPEQKTATETVTISELSLAGTQAMPSQRNTTNVMELKDVPSYTLQIEEEAPKRSFIDRLPIDELKKDQMKNIASAVSDVYNDVSNAKDELYKRSISIKVEKRKLFISF